MKKILLFFILLSTFSFSFDYQLSLDTFGPLIRVGLKRFESNSIYIKSINGNLLIKYNNKTSILSKNDSIKITYYNNKIKILNSITNKIIIKKLDIISMFDISKNGKTYSTYRGELELLPHNNHILPINIVRTEEYLYSVVPSEIGFSFPDEAIKAQAVAARTYLFYSMKNKKFDLYDVEDGVTSQVYLGYNKENKRINDLINQTENQVITYNGKYINALFHASSGGYTANSEDVWGSKIPYLRSVDDRKNDIESPRRHWSYKINKQDFSKLIGFKVSYIKIIEIKSKRAKKVKIIGDKTITISGDKLRQIVGYSKIFSTMFTIKSSGNYFYFSGSGSGHGVGLPQWSAYTLAKKGKNYIEILKKYYQGVSIKSINYQIAEK
ncbi:stage II sporulation protein D [Hypnocyclicus thermotrophus]|uniref:Stage II sporulation protein D n=1 Tax=Hypnocyclicus thermotrophus TaxID=1627895 RepID=A0AA46DXU2_9FUSO|nr:SpoIID/LytB domain-containing protein [Hypnocyclicus thermotrophus]TDT68637.1 stage II sporulation protein D [Hypnocyclicus thermotrophus]